MKRSYFDFLSYPKCPIRAIKLITLTIITAIISSSTIAPAFAAPPNASFKDVANKHWASKQIKTLANWQVIDGQANGDYKPNNNLRRSELAKLLSEAFKLQNNINEDQTNNNDENDALDSDSTSTPPKSEDSTGTVKSTQSTAAGQAANNALAFTDLKSDHWANNFIITTVNAKWMTGFPDGCFKPDDYTTRAQVAKILCQARNYSMDATDTPTFKDVSEKHWANSYIRVAAKAKLLTGYPDGSFKPDYKITRAEAAALIYRALIGSDILVESYTKSGATYDHYRRFTDDGSLNLHVLTVPKNASVSPKLGLAKDRVTGLERVSSMANRYDALAGVNGDFFSTDVKSGSSGILAENQLISSPLVNRSYFGIATDGTYFMDRSAMQATVTAANGKKGLVAWVNKNRDNFTDTIVAYTPIYGTLTKTTTDTGSEVVLRLDNMPITTEFETTATVVEVRNNNGNTSIPSDGIVLSGIGSSKTYLDANFKTGDSVKLSFNMQPSIPANAIVVGGGPRLIRDGVVGVESEGFSIGGRRARTGIGYDADGNLKIVVVDGGIGNYSIGMTLAELGEELKSRGAIEAMNLDGGTSSTFYVDGSVRNYPGQGEGERAVCSSLLFISK
jgi:exopolysaccharide biosynthesis protein